jgi:hypothetical protein
MAVRKAIKKRNKSAIRRTYRGNEKATRKQEEGKKME